MASRRVSIKSKVGPDTTENRANEDHECTVNQVDSNQSRMAHVFPKLSLNRKASERVRTKALKAQPKNKVTRKMINGLKSIDIYGQAINLSYRGEEKFKTIPGALMSIWVIVIFLAYTVYKSYILFDRVNPNINRKGLVRNLDQEEAFRPQDLGFDFSFGVKEPLDPQIAFYTVTENVQGYREDSKGVWGSYKTKQDLEYAECGDDLFNHDNQTEVKMYGINRLMCFKRKNYSLQGDFYSNTFRYITIKLSKCKVNCKNASEINSYLSGKTFSIAFINQYFDYNDFTIPIKSLIDDSVFTLIESDKIKRLNFYVMKSYIQLQDEYFQLGQSVTDNFANVVNLRPYDDSNESDDGTVVQIFIRYDSRYDYYERRVYSMLELLGDIGGLQQSLYIIGLIMCQFFTYRIFLSSVLKQIYQVKHDKRFDIHALDTENGGNSPRKGKAIPSTITIEHPDNSSTGQLLKNGLLRKSKDIHKSLTTVQINTYHQHNVDMEREVPRFETRFRKSGNPMHRKLATAISPGAGEETSMGGTKSQAQFSQHTRHESGIVKRADIWVQNNLKKRPSAQQNKFEVPSTSPRQDTLEGRLEVLERELESNGEGFESFNHHPLHGQPSPFQKEYSAGNFADNVSDAISQAPMMIGGTISQEDFYYPRYDSPVNRSPTGKIFAGVSRTNLEPIMEKDESYRFDQVLKRKQRLTKADIGTILVNLINRKRFTYTFKDICESLVKCLFLRKTNATKDKQHFLFKKGEHKLKQELDMISLLKSMRQIKLLTQVILNQRQKMLLRFQRKNIIETSSSSCDSDFNNRVDAASLMEHQNPIVRLTIFGRIKRMVNTYREHRLRTFDKRLVRGLFLRNLKDFDEDYYEMLANKSLLERIKGALNQSFDSNLQAPSSSDILDHQLPPLDYLNSARGSEHQTITNFNPYQNVVFGVKKGISVTPMESSRLYCVESLREDRTKPQEQIPVLVEDIQQQSRNNEKVSKEAVAERYEGVQKNYEMSFSAVSRENPNNPLQQPSVDISHDYLLLNKTQQDDPNAWYDSMSMGAQNNLTQPQVDPYGVSNPRYEQYPSSRLSSEAPIQPVSIVQNSIQSGFANPLEAPKNLKIHRPDLKSSLMLKKERSREKLTAKNAATPPPVIGVQQSKAHLAAIGAHSVGGNKAGNQYSQVQYKHQL
ncbi:hypothetical protein FGO68_gene3405 [Halteria grandinella]|uniref:Uncharacterized protein n=1 Tax=Halteria grandinella TaxID=5974 RepID=A0A8J8T7N8_HALGN|nr:hypothetical protein FGO68_gene3405 [Halteria grandinella]